MTETIARLPVSYVAYVVWAWAWQSYACRKSYRGLNIKETHFSNNITTDPRSKMTLNISEIMNMCWWSPSLISNAQNIKRKLSWISICHSQTIIYFSETRHSTASVLYAGIYNTVHIVKGHTAELVNLLFIPSIKFCIYYPYRFTVGSCFFVSDPLNWWSRCCQHGRT